MESYVQKLHPAWTVDNLSININTTDVPMENLLSYEVAFTGSSIIGFISFMDNDDLVSKMPISVGGFIEIGFTSQMQTKYLSPSNYTKKYTITKVGSTIQVMHNIVSLEFEDFNTTKLKTSYISKSYTDITPADMMSKYVTELQLENVLIAGKETEDNVSIHTPAHMSASEFLNKDLEYRGYELIQDRYNSYIVHNSHRYPEKAVSTGEFFEYMPKDQASRAQVLEYKVSGFDMEALQKSIPTITSNINMEKISQEKINTKVIVAESNSTAQVGGIPVTELLNNSGAKLSGGYSDGDPDNVTKELKNLQKMSIWVPGWNGNRLGMSVKIELPKPININQSENSETYSGIWIVNQVRDKIINSYFIQELFVSRAGNA